WELPRDAQAHLELGIVEMDNFGNLDEALRLFQRACQLNPRFGVAWFFEGVVLLRKNRFADALKSLAQAERQGHRTALVAEARADAYYKSGSFLAAAKNYEVALSREPSNPLFEGKLGLAFVRANDPEGGLQRLQHAIESRSSAPELHDRLILALVSLERIAEAAQAAEATLGALSSPSPSAF